MYTTKLLLTNVIAAWSTCYLDYGLGTLILETGVCVRFRLPRLGKDQDFCQIFKSLVSVEFFNI